jgi:hypothetical protein
VILAIRWQPIPLDGHALLAAGAGVASVTELGLLLLLNAAGKRDPLGAVEVMRLASCAAVAAFLVPGVSPSAGRGDSRARGMGRSDGHRAV